VSGPSQTKASEPVDVAALDHWSRITVQLERAHGNQRVPMRADYTWSVLHAADVARHLQIPAISVVELGVAGGHGLVALEAAAKLAESELGVEVAVHGFDTGSGLPTPVDHRDAPYLMATGDFPMDEERLRARLERATLHLGDVKETIPAFVAAGDAPPVGFVANDLDYYSSSMDAFNLFLAPPELLLPRIMCYFDDTLGYPWGHINGEQLAITDFNEAHPQRQLSHLDGLRWMVPAGEFDARWTEAMYVAHALDHPRYAEDEGVTWSRRLDL